MAGVVPKRSTSGRKQWTLHGKQTPNLTVHPPNSLFTPKTIADGPRNSLKRLRSQLASDGCPESQVVLAKQLLYEQCGNESFLLRDLATGCETSFILQSRTLISAKMHGWASIGWSRRRSRATRRQRRCWRNVCWRGGESPSIIIWMWSLVLRWRRMRSWRGRRPGICLWGE